MRRIDIELDVRRVSVVMYTASWLGSIPHGSAAKTGIATWDALLWLNRMQGGAGRHGMQLEASQSVSSQRQNVEEWRSTEEVGGRGGC